MAKYDVFISYSRKDSAIVKRIETDLANRGYSVWIDRDGIFSGDAFKKVLVDAISNSKLVLFISSKHSNSSEWTSKEIGIALSEKIKVLPVKIDDVRYNPEVRFDLINIDYISLFDESNSDCEYNRMLESINRIVHKSSQASDTSDKNNDEHLYDEAQNLKANGNISEHLRLLRELAEKGLLKAMINLGVHLLQSKDVKSENEGFGWINRACKTMSPESPYAGISYYNIGRCYECGIGTCADTDKAFYYYRQAATVGHPKAQYKLGDAYEADAFSEALIQGDTDNADYSEAISWYKKAAAQGNIPAKTRLEKLGVLL